MISDPGGSRTPDQQLSGPEAAAYYGRLQAERRAQEAESQTSHEEDSVHTASQVSTEPDPELQAFLVSQINGWKLSGHDAERLARLVELAVRQQVRAELEASS